MTMTARETSLMLRRRPGSRRRWRPAGIVAAMGLALISVSACDVGEFLEVPPDPTFVDAVKNPPLFTQSMAGMTVDLYWAYDLHVWYAGSLAGDHNGLGGIRWNVYARLPNDNWNQSGGLTGGNRNFRGPSVTLYGYLHGAIQSARSMQGRILDGEFAQISDPPNSAAYAQASLYRGLAIQWLSTFYCYIVLDEQPTAYTSRQGFEIANEQFQKALDASAATPEIHQAALVALARGLRFLGDDAEAVKYASQVDPAFELEAYYSTNTFAQTNFVWFRLWAWGEHTVAPKFRGLTIDDSGVPDPRVKLVPLPVPPRGDFDVGWSPQKILTGNTPLTMASGIEALYIIAEANLATDPDRTVELINEIRTRRGVNVQWQPQGAGPNEIRDKLIDERQRTLYLEGTSLSDLRLYIAKYDLDLFQTSMPQPFTMGDITCQFLPSREIDAVGLASQPGLTRP